MMGLSRSIGIAALMCVGATGLLAEGPPGSVSLLKPLERFQECDVCPDMIALPMGVFTIAATPEEVGSVLALKDGKFTLVGPEDPLFRWEEGPLHPVQIDVPIAMSRHEITFAEWDACVADGGCGGHMPVRKTLRSNPETEAIEWMHSGPDHPVMDVSFGDAMAYADWLNEKLGAEVYRLPTEAEWEYAARAGTQTAFAQGARLYPHQANYHESEKTQDYLGIDEPENLNLLGAAVPVNALDAANAWGLRHMSGNVSEWTLSCWSDDYIGWSTSSEWLAESPGPSCDRVTRGGAYHLAMNYARVAWRGRRREGGGSSTAGIRILREINDRIDPAAIENP